MFHLDSNFNVLQTYPAFKSKEAALEYAVRLLKAQAADLERMVQIYEKFLTDLKKDMRNKWIALDPQTEIYLKNELRVIDNWESITSSLLI